MAAIQGIDMEGDRETTSTMTGDDVKRRVEAKLAGKTEEQLGFDEVGIQIIVED